MPEATIYENGEALPGEDEVGAAWDCRVAPPPLDTMLSEYADEGELRFLVTTGAYGSHCVAALRLCEYVWHCESLIERVSDVRCGSGASFGSSWVVAPKFPMCVIGAVGHREVAPRIHPSVGFWDAGAMSELKINDRLAAAQELLNELFSDR